MAGTVGTVRNERATGVPATDSAPRLRDTWPLTWPDAGLLAAAYVVLTLVWVGIGELLTGPLEDSALVKADQDVAEWFADHRTETWNTWADAGAMLADTVVKIVVTAVVAGIMLAVWRRWREPLLVIVALVLEASAFITITWLVGRPRPDVPRLESSPVASSFPSGHTAAAAAYTAIAVVIFWHTKNVWIRTVAVVVSVALPVIVGLARTYAGMHYLTDVIAGALLGWAAVLVAWWVLRPARTAARES
jgi:undecaprenyl-diphosphatase